VVKVIGQWWQLHTWHRCHGVPFTLDELRVVVEEAHAAGLPVTAHSHGLPAVEQAVAVGVDGIEHCSFLSASGIEQPDELLESLAASQITVCLTLGWAPGAAPSPAVPGWCPTVAGSDAGIGPVKPHGFQAESIVAMVDAGVPAAEPSRRQPPGRRRPAARETVLAFCGPGTTPICCCRGRALGGHRRPASCLRSHDPRDDDRHPGGHDTVAAFGVSHAHAAVTLVLLELEARPRGRSRSCAPTCARPADVGRRPARPATLDTEIASRSG
jgi:hypothetical protein